MKKQLALVATLGAITMFTSGCSKEEMELYEVMQDAAGVQIAQSEGEITIDVKGQDAISNMLKNYKLSYTADYDLSAGKMAINFDLKNGATTQGRAEVIMTNDKVYIKVDDIITLINQVAPQMLEGDRNKSTMEALKDVKYVVFDVKDLGINTKLVNGAKSYSEAIYDILEAIANGSAKDYTTGIVSKDGLEYVISLNKDNISKFIKDLSIFLVGNSKEIATDVQKFMKENSTKADAIFDYLGIDKDEFLDALDEFVSYDSATEVGEMKAEIQKLDIDKFFKEAGIDDLTLKMKISKSGDNYNESVVIGGSVNGIGASLNVTEKVKKVASVSIKEPTEGLKLATDIEKELDQKALKTRKVVANIKSNDVLTYEYNELVDSDELEFLNVDGRTYIQMRQMSDLLGQEINYDGKPYFVVDGKNSYVDEYIIKDGRTYLKTRALENIGYKIDWNEETRDITLSR